MIDEVGEIYEFGPYRLNVGERMLQNSDDDDSICRLPDKAFQTLVVLVRRSGHLVTRKELLDEVWPDSFVEENNVDKCIHAIRQTIGDSVEQKFVETVRKHGFRFVGEVHSVAASFDFTAADVPEGADETVTQFPHLRTVSAGALPAEFGRSGGSGARLSRAATDKAEVPEHVVPFPTRPNANSLHVVGGTAPARNRSKIYMIGAVALLAVIGAGVFLTSQLTAENSQKRMRIAVLPLKPVDITARDTGLEFAIADALILKLSETATFDVKRLNAIRKFVDLEGDPIDAGRQLNVDYVLSSNYQTVDGRLRVTSQLLNVNSGKTEHTFRAESDASSIFVMQDTAANEIGNALLAKFGAPASVFAARRGTENEEAYTLYQQAWYLIDKGTAEESAKAAKLLERAVELDPNYSQAWAVRSHAYCQFAHLGGGEPRSVFATAEPMLERSMLIDPSNAMAYTIRGTINRDFHWNFPQAINDLKQAIQLDPSTVLAHRVLAGVYYRNGQFAEALESQKRAVDLNPTSLHDQLFLGIYLVAAGHKSEGMMQLSRVVEMNPKFPPVYEALWEIYSSEGEHARAYENFIKLKEAYGMPTELIADYNDAYRRSGWPGVLRVELEWLRSKEPEGFCNYKFYIAGIAALSGERDLAFRYLDLAIQYRLISVSFLKVDRKLDSLRDDPRFARVLNRAGVNSSS